MLREILAWRKYANYNLNRKSQVIGTYLYFRRADEMPKPWNVSYGRSPTYKKWHVHKMRIF